VGRLPGWRDTELYVCGTSPSERHQGQLPDDVEGSTTVYHSRRRYRQRAVVGGVRAPEVPTLIVHDAVPADVGDLGHGVPAQRAGAPVAEDGVELGPTRYARCRVQTVRLHGVLYLPLLRLAAGGSHHGENVERHFAAPCEEQVHPQCR